MRVDFEGVLVVLVREKGGDALSEGVHGCAYKPRREQNHLDVRNSLSADETIDMRRFRRDAPIPVLHSVNPLSILCSLILPLAGSLTVYTTSSLLTSLTRAFRIMLISLRRNFSCEAAGKERGPVNDTCHSLR